MNPIAQSIADIAIYGEPRLMPTLEGDIALAYQGTDDFPADQSEQVVYRTFLLLVAASLGWEPTVQELQPTAPEDEEWAFWSYDAWPYVLWGKVTEKHFDYRKRLYVRVEGYGASAFYPEFILTGDEGRHVADTLAFMRTSLRQQLQRIQRQYCDEALVVLPQLLPIMQRSLPDWYKK